MRGIKRIKNLLVALWLLLYAWGMLEFPEEGPETALFFFSIALILMGAKYLLFYFTMARFMVGGKELLYRGAIILDLGIFALGITDVPNFYIMLYFVGIMSFYGVLTILNAVEAKRVMAPHWKLKFAEGAVALAFGIICLLNLSSVRLVAYALAADFTYLAIVRIITAFRKTAIVYIE